VHVEKAQSVYRYIEDGRKILDAISSWWVTLDGHANPRIVADSRAGEETSMGRQSAGRGRFEEKLSA
jgi:adenosylmethionine-8-amino-7-oxononanoate aminotransferase